MNKLKHLNLSGEEKISDFPKKFNKLLNIVERLIYITSLLFALVITPIINTLLSGQISYILNIFDIAWNKLSEGYQLLILGLPIMIIGGIVTHFINKKYIDPLFNKNLPS